VFHNLFSPAVHPKLSKTHDGTPQNIASWKGGAKLYMGINMYLHINTFTIRMQAYENKTLHMLDKIIDDEPLCLSVCLSVCVCVCVCVCVRVCVFYEF
jgi:hypothetical protein